MSTSNINIRVDSDIKAQAQQIFATLGMDMSTAINIFLRQSIREQSIPFAITARTEESVQRIPRPGKLKGKIWMSEDFNAPLEDFADSSS